jgi:predicted metal-dependent hydrolase
MDGGRRGEVLEAWYHDQLRKEAKPLTPEWERQLGVRVDRVFIQRMKTRWGSCNPGSHAIRLNKDLAKKPRECFEYSIHPAKAAGAECRRWAGDHRF